MAERVRTRIHGRVLVPLWARLGLVFGGAVGLFVSVYGWWSFREDLVEEMHERERVAIGLAETLAAGIDPEFHRSLESASDMARPEFVRTQRWLAGARDHNRAAWVGTLKRDERGRFFFAIDADLESPVPVGYPVFDGFEVRGRVYEGETLFLSDFQDEWGFWQQAFAPIHAEDGAVVGIVEVVYSADSRLLDTRVRSRRLITQTLLVVIVALAAAFLSARYLNRYLGSLTEAALDVADGDLERRVEIPTSDEIGLLGSAFNAMVAGLKEREFIRDTFGRFVDKEVVAQLLADPKALKLGGDARNVTIAMSDLRGFTALTERNPPEEMVALLNRYFARMEMVIERYQGTIGEYVGDGIVTFFGTPSARPDDAVRAVACAVAMQQELVRFNREEGRSLQMGVGIDTGVVIAGNIGSERHMKYGVVGRAINLAARLEGFTIGSQVLVSTATAEAAGPVVQLGEPLEFLAKGRSDPLVVYPVLGVGPPWEVHMPDALGSALGVEVDLEAGWHRIEGKKVVPEEIPARLARVALPSITLRTRESAAVYDAVRVRVRIGETDHPDVYGTVTAMDGERMALHVTSMPDETRTALESLK